MILNKKRLGEVKSLLVFALPHIKLQNECGGYCICCALAKAKFEYDNMHNVEWTWEELFSSSTVLKDRVLSDAILYLNKKEMIFKTKDQAINFLRTFIIKLKHDSSERL